MRPVAPDRRPPVAAWGFAGLVLLPLIASWFADWFGWLSHVYEAGGLYGLILLGFAAGAIAAPELMRGRWRLAFLGCAVPVLAMGLLMGFVLDIRQIAALGLVLIFGLDLWAERAGRVPAWWPRLKGGFTILAVALLLGPGIG
ncbi:MAG: hypothetical protein ACK5LJ_04060 [Paracoccus sp. (in: a-proteobacteria)]